MRSDAHCAGLAQALKSVYDAHTLAQLEAEPGQGASSRPSPKPKPEGEPEAEPEPNHSYVEAY